MLPHLRRRAAILACVLACTWAALLVAAPWLASSSHRLVASASALSYVAGSLLCHQLPGRSFHLAGAQLPVCARCTGLYLGGALGLVVGVLLPLFGRRDPGSALASRWSWRAVLAVAALPMVLTVALEWTGAWAASNAWRAALSLPVAWAAGALVAESLSFRVTL